MRDQLHEFDQAFVAMRLGRDAYCFCDTPKIGKSVDLLPMLPMLIEHGLDAPPYKRWTPDGNDDDRRAMSLVSLYLGSGGSIVVYPKRSVDVPEVPIGGEVLTDEEALHIAVNGIVALTQKPEPTDDNDDHDQQDPTNETSTEADADEPDDAEPGGQDADEMDGSSGD